MQSLHYSKFLRSTTYPSPSFAISEALGILKPYLFSSWAYKVLSCAANAAAIMAPSMMWIASATVRMLPNASIPFKFTFKIRNQEYQYRHTIKIASSALCVMTSAVIWLYIALYSIYSILCHLSSMMHHHWQKEDHSWIETLEWCQFQLGNNIVVNSPTPQHRGLYPNAHSLLLQICRSALPPANYSPQSYQWKGPYELMSVSCPSNLRFMEWLWLCDGGRWSDSEAHLKPSVMWTEDKWIWQTVYSYSRMKLNTCIVLYSNRLVLSK